MSSKTFAISLGVSAIDGLLCAFVAVLVLALILIGPGTSTGAPDLSRTHILRFDIAKIDHGSTGVDLRLLINIHDSRSSSATRPNVQSRSAMTPLKGDGLENILLKGGDIMWRDCQVSVGSHCSAFLVVRKIKEGQRWNVQIRVADAQESFTSGGSSYKVGVKIDNGKPQDNLLLTPAEGINVCADWDKTRVDPNC